MRFERIVSANSTSRASAGFDFDESCLQHEFRLVLGHQITLCAFPHWYWESFRKFFQLCNVFAR